MARPPALPCHKAQGCHRASTLRAPKPLIVSGPLDVEAGARFGADCAKLAARLTSDGLRGRYIPPLSAATDEGASRPEGYGENAPSALQMNRFSP